MSNEPITDKAAMQDEAMDALDAFMMSIKSGGMDSKTRMELKRRGVELRQQRTQLECLVALAKPCSLPPLSSAKLVVITVFIASFAFYLTSLFFGDISSVWAPWL